MSNFIVAIAVFLITVIGALFAVPYLVDWNGYRSVFEEEATRLLGREVRVGGAVNLHLLPTPYFRFEKVRIADTSVNLQEPFFRTDSLTIKLAIPPMIRGVVEANEIELQRPVLRLALDGSDGWNWQSFGQVLGNVRLPAGQGRADVGQDRRRRARRARRPTAPSAPASRASTASSRRRRSTAPIGCAAPSARPAPSASCRSPRRGRRPTAPCASRRSCGSRGRLDLHAGRPPRRPHGQAAHRGRAHGAAADRRAVAGAPPRHAAAAAERRGRRRRDQARTRARPRSTCRPPLDADPAGATLSDLALSFEQDGRPQLITGELKAAWRDALAVEMSLASRWLDLDRIAGASEDAGPLDSIVPLAIGLRDLLPAESRSRATFPIDQANVGQRSRQRAAPGARPLAGQARDRGAAPRPAGRQPRRAAGRRHRPARGAGVRRQRRPARHEPRALPRLGDGRRR